ncbi:aminotransferase class IV [Riemerella columbipharyngis]|uniref:4-amino-4-deoxychorismate lyase n=1 Tax=Riemerella columbipharyngis TaxID=1071918 RepID=A0A1G7DFY2_9FLAO|nr:aminotransferase class IV [Riemerella columbipharyngis]SDE50471.1 4-amino-4-deoxychorismate lyase [Riemerella columbipharyngis]
MSRFIESIKAQDRQIYLLDLHQERIDRTFFEKTGKRSFSLENILSNIEIPDFGKYKMRVVYDLRSSIKVELIPYQPAIAENFELMENSGIDYHLKYENRTIFSEMKQASKAQEIIILKGNKITDSSYSNIIFFDGSQWFTPKTYLLNGVQRQRLIAQNKITEADISLRHILDFSHFKLINAMNDLEEAVPYPIDKIINFPN